MSPVRSHPWSVPSKADTKVTQQEGRKKRKAKRLCVTHFWSLKKNWLKEDGVLENFFKQTYCHTCLTRFAVFFPLSSGCVSSLITR